MSKLLDAMKMAWVGFCTEMHWDYAVKLSYGPSFSRKTTHTKKTSKKEQR